MWPWSKKTECPHCGAQASKKEVPYLGRVAEGFGALFFFVALVALFVSIPKIYHYGWGAQSEDLLVIARRESFEQALEELNEIDGGPYPFVAEFKQSRTLSGATRSRLAEPPRAQVLAVIEGHEGRTAEAREDLSGMSGYLVEVRTTVAGIGLGLFVLAMLIGASRKKWVCAGCGKSWKDGAATPTT